MACAVAFKPMYGCLNLEHTRTDFVDDLYTSSSKEVKSPLNMCEDIIEQTPSQLLLKILCENNSMAITTKEGRISVFPDCKMFNEKERISAKFRSCHNLPAEA